MSLKIIQDFIADTEEEIKKLEEEEKKGAFNGIWIAANREALDILKNGKDIKDILNKLEERYEEYRDMACCGVFKGLRNQIIYKIEDLLKKREDKKGEGRLW